MTTTAIDQVIARATDLQPNARPEFLKLHTAAEVLAIHERLVGEAKPKTPRPVLERRILAALAAPAVAQDEPAGEPPHADAGGDAAQPDASDAPGADGDEDEEPAAGAGPDERLPAVGTWIVKRDRQGAERCRCQVVEGGIYYDGVIYKSISAAATVAQRALELTSKTVNGYLFWQLDTRDAGERKPRPAKDHGPALAKVWERYTELARAAIAANPGAVREQLGAQCNAHNDLVASAITAAA